jgi:hypothetical protein
MPKNDKQHALRLIRELPEDSTLDEVIKALYIEQMIRESDADFAAGRVLTHEQVKKEAESWFKSSGRKGRSGASQRSTASSPKTTRRRRSA